MTAILIENICKTFKARGRRVLALNNLSLEIGQGEVFGFLGPNGAGKSTTIKILLGMVGPTSGSASICGVPVNLSTSRQKVGYLPESPSFYDFLTAREYLTFVGKSFGMNQGDIVTETKNVLALVDLESAADRPIKGYSKGMVQRLGVGQTLLHNPDIYILDEPMSGLDPLGRSLVKDVIGELRRRGKTVFFSTHITSDVEIVCDRVGIISNGVLQAVHDVRKLMQSGIEGYRIQISDCSIDDFGDFSVYGQSGSLVEIIVPKERMQEFMELIHRTGGSVDLIEPQRKTLERYFLEIIGQKYE